MSLPHENTELWPLMQNQVSRTSIALADPRRGFLVDHPDHTAAALTRRFLHRQGLVSGRFDPIESRIGKAAQCSSSISHFRFIRHTSFITARRTECVLF